MLDPLPPDVRRLATGVLALRVTVAVLLAIHGWFRFLTGGYAPFGEYLAGAGWPLGGVIAIAITAYEILGTPLLAWGRLVLPLCAGYVFILTAGMLMVHASSGWFVVGGGRNGMEYSVLLIACLLLVAYQELPRGARSR